MRTLTLADAVALIPDVSRWTFEGVGHCVAQEAPGMVIEALAAFERQSG